MRGLRRTDALVPLVAVTGAAIWLGTLSGGNARSSDRFTVRASAAASAEAAALPSCTARGERVNFAVFTLGPRFVGLKQSNAVRRCDRPELNPEGVSMTTAGGPRHAFRANYTSMIYGTCRAATGSGCAPPLEVQTWPACERNAGTYERAVRPTLRVRGAPAAVFEDGRRIEVYTARATVVVFARTRALAKRAARSVASRAPGAAFPGRSSAATARASARRPLARPAAGAMRGRLRCRQVSISSRGGV